MTTTTEGSENAHLAALQQLLDDPNELARSIVSRVEVDTEGGRITVGLFSSAWEVYEGVRVLLERRLAPEALMLYRTLLDNAALLMWFAARKEEVDILALRYYWSSVKYSRDVAAAARANGWAWAEEMFTARAEEIEELRKAAKEHELDEPEHLPKPRDLLEELNQGRLYYWHVKASQTIHGTGIGLSSRLRIPDDGSAPVEIPLVARIDEVVQIGIIAAETFVAAMQAAAALLGWDERESASSATSSRRGQGNCSRVFAGPSSTPKLETRRSPVHQRSEWCTLPALWRPKLPSGRSATSVSVQMNKRTLVSV